MKKRSVSIIYILFCVLLLISSCQKEDIATTQNFLDYLPKPGETGEWKASLTPDEYKGEDLYLYIDGGAEIYHEYGFRRIVVQDFVNQEEKSLSLEIFQMKSTESAYGIYTFKRSMDGRTLDVGQGGRLEGYYLNFWKGPYLVTITGFDEDPETVKGLVLLAKAVNNKIPTSVEEPKPEIVSLLPQESLIPASIKYFRGHLGLFNTYPISSKNLFRFKEGVRGFYEDRTDFFILRYENELECQNIFEQSKKILRTETKYKNFIEGEFHYQFEDERNKIILIQPVENYILIIAGAQSSEIAQEKIQEFEKTI